MLKILVSWVINGMEKYNFHRFIYVDFNIDFLGRNKLIISFIYVKFPMSNM